MRTYLLFVLLLFSLNCTRSGDDKSKIVSDMEWEDILSQTLFFLPADTLPIDKFFVYNKYCNIEMSPILKGIYEYCDEKFSYEVSDSIIASITARRNGYIQNKIDTTKEMSYIKDTSSIEGYYFTYTEPFYVDSGKLCLALSCKEKNIGVLNKWVCFFEEQQYLKLIGYYDLNKEQIYTTAKW